MKPWEAAQGAVVPVREAQGWSPVPVYEETGSGWHPGWGGWQQLLQTPWFLQLTALPLSCLPAPAAQASETQTWAEYPFRGPQNELCSLAPCWVPFLQPMTQWTLCFSGGRGWKGARVPALERQPWPWTSQAGRQSLHLHSKGWA